MRVELNKANKRVSFIWGAYSDIPAGHIVIRWNDFDLGRGADMTETYSLDAARAYWKQLVGNGYKVHPIAT